MTLTSTELSLNLRYLSFLSKLGFLPVKVHRRKGKVQVLHGRDNLRWCVFALASQLSLAHAAFVLLINVYRTNFANAMRRFLIEYTLAYTFVLALCMRFLSSIMWPQVSDGLCNQSFKTENVGARKTSRFLGGWYGLGPC